MPFAQDQTWASPRCSCFVESNLLCGSFRQSRIQDSRGRNYFTLEKWSAQRPIRGFGRYIYSSIRQNFITSHKLITASSHGTSFFFRNATWEAFTASLLILSWDENSSRSTSVFGWRPFTAYPELRFGKVRFSQFRFGGSPCRKRSDGVSDVCAVDFHHGWWQCGIPKNEFQYYDPEFSHSVAIEI